MNKLCSWALFYVTGAGPKDNSPSLTQGSDPWIHSHSCRKILRHPQSQCYRNDCRVGFSHFLRSANKSSQAWTPWSDVLELSHHCLGWDEPVLNVQPQTKQNHTHKPSCENVPLIDLFFFSPAVHPTIEKKNSPQTLTTQKSPMGSTEGIRVCKKVQGFRFLNPFTFAGRN